MKVADINVPLQGRCIIQMMLWISWRHLPKNDFSEIMTTVLCLTDNKSDTAGRFNYEGFEDAKILACNDADIGHHSFSWTRIGHFQILDDEIAEIEENIESHMQEINSPIESVPGISFRLVAVMQVYLQRLINPASSLPKMQLWKNAVRVICAVPCS